MASLVNNGLIKTAAVEQVVAPIAGHLCHLVLLCESTEEPELFTRLEGAAHAVAKATANLAAVASRQMAETEDDVMRMEMSSLLESVTVSGQHVLLAAQTLSIQPSLAEHREDLITATQNVLLGVVKVLLVEDDSTVRAIIASADTLLQCLCELGSSRDIPSLLKCFQKFSEALLLFNTLTAKRAKTLQDPLQTEHLDDSLKTLRKCISMLHTATCTTIKHPASEQAQAAKRYILDKVESTINDIVATLQSERHRGSLGPYGYYRERHIGLIQILSNTPLSPGRDRVFDSMLRDLVFHCMMVANSSRKEIQLRVVDYCRHILQLWSDILQMYQFPQEPDPSTSHLQNLRVLLMQQIQMLDGVMMTAALYQVLDTFLPASSSFEILMNMTGQILNREMASELDPDWTQSLLEDFLSEADSIIKVASFIAALATDAKSLENMENSRACLTRLRAGIAHISLDLGNVVSEQYLSAVQKLSDLCQRWEEEATQLQDAVSDVIDVREFTSLALHEMSCDRHGCDEAYKEQSYDLFRQHAHKLICHMKQMTHSVKRHLDRSDNPIYRNGLLVFLRQVDTWQSRVAGSVGDMLSGFGLNVEAHSTFSGNVAMALQHFALLREGLDGKQHPHLLSPLREEARQTAATPSDAHVKEANVLDHVRLDFTHQPPDLEADERLSQTEREEERLERDSVETVMPRQYDTDDLKEATVSNKPKPTHQSLDFHLLPLLFEVVTVTEGKDLAVLGKACTEVLELSNCYTQATKEASAIVDAVDCQTLDNFRADLVSLTPLLVQTAQETAMSSGRSLDPIYKHSTQFSDLIKNIQKVLLPVAGTWYHAIHTMFQGTRPDKLAIIAHQLREVMVLFTDVVQLLTVSDITIHRDCLESFTVLHSKLNKAQNNTRHLAELASSVTGQVEHLEGQCVLWALNMQVLLNSLDKIFATATAVRQLSPQKRLAAVFEISVRTQEAARLTSLHCKSVYKVKLLTEYQDELKALTEEYLQCAEDLNIMSAGVLQLARSELLYRKVLIKMTVISGYLNKANKDYVTVIQNMVNLAYSAAEHQRDEKMTEEAEQQFEKAAELLLENVRATTKSVEDSFNYIRDPKTRSNLRSINDHLSFQISDIVSRARVILETRCICDTLSLEIQVQCWTAKAHYVAEEICKTDGIRPEVKELVKNGLQGQTHRDGKDMSPGTSALKPVDLPTETPIKSWQKSGLPEVTDTAERNMAAVSEYEPLEKQHEGARCEEYREVPSLTYTSLFLRQETDRWDAKGNRIVQVTKEMADQIYYMTQYLRRKGPIANKEAFVNTAKDVVSNCKSITQFVQVIADHCLDKQCTLELSLIVEQILTVTNQLTIISSVNAVTPGSKSSDEILVKNAQNILKIILQGVNAAETASIKGLKQPEPNSDGAEAAALCFQWRRNLLIHQAQQNSNSDTDDLGLRKTSSHPLAPSLAHPIQGRGNNK